MSQKLFVGNIDWNTTVDELRELFSQFGEVEDVTIIEDRETGRPRGFGFVTMVTEEGADAAIAELDGYELNGRALGVNKARPQEKREFTRSPRRDDRGGRNDRNDRNDYRSNDRY